MNYKLNKGYLGGESSSVNRINNDGSIISIPFDQENTDYQEYLKWVAAGNTPLPADGE